MDLAATLDAGLQATYPKAVHVDRRLLGEANEAVPGFKGPAVCRAQTQAGRKTLYPRSVALRVIAGRGS